MNINTLALDNLANALNQYLALDSQSLDKIKALNGKVLKLTITPIYFYIVFNDSRIELKPTIEDEPDTSIEGLPWSYIQMHFASSTQKSQLFKDGLSIKGDIDFGQKVQALFNEIDIDWEEHLSKLTGDIVANEFFKLCHSTKKWADNFKESMRLNTRDYLQEESDFLPTQEELQDFYDDVDSLALRVDRLSAKMKEFVQ